jgi:transcriptional regulator with XRE-family HTH domain
MAGRVKASLASESAFRSLAIRMRDEREKQQISLTKMAELTGYAKSHLSTIENARSKPNLEVIAKYEEVLKMERGSLSSMLGGEPPILRSRPTGGLVPAALTNPQESIVIRQSLPTAVLSNLIAQSEHRIWILENWIGDDLRYLADAFIEADARGVEIKIALLKEDTPFANQRTTDLRLDPEIQQIDTRQLIMGNKRLLGNWLKQTQHMQVREHNSLPSIQIIIIDDVGLVGFYLHGMTSRGGPQLEVPILKEGRGKQYSALGFHLEKEFGYVWDEATEFVAK